MQDLLLLWQCLKIYIYIASHSICIGTVMGSCTSEWDNNHLQISLGVHTQIRTCKDLLDCFVHTIDNKSAGYIDVYVVISVVCSIWQLQHQKFTKWQHQRASLRGNWVISWTTNFIIIISYSTMLLFYSCIMGMSGLPDMYTRCSRAAAGIHIR